MTMTKRDRVVKQVKEAVVEAGSRFRPDQLEVYKRAISQERNRKAKWVLEQILDNARIANDKKIPLCDDTGTPHVILEIGNKAKIPPGFFHWINEGIAEGLRTLPGRPMAVKGPPLERVGQRKGLFKDPARMVSAPFIVRPRKGDKIRITVLFLGGGPEIRARTARIFHERSAHKVLTEAAMWVKEEVKNLGCTPTVIGVGIGRTHMEASCLMLEAMSKGDLTRQSEWEKQFTKIVNESGVGPLGLGGTTTALGTFINIGPLRASGVRIVAVRPACCVEPRRASAVL
jgi:fumarate hydratase subunit alpha